MAVDECISQGATVLPVGYPAETTAVHYMCVCKVSRRDLTFGSRLLHFGGYTLQSNDEHPEGAG